MSDLSIISSQQIKSNNNLSDKKTTFSKLNKEYNSFLKKSSKTDFANSPVILEQELTMLAKLKEAAEKEGLKDELQTIKNREQAIFTQLANKSFSSLPNVYYAPVSFKGTQAASIVSPEKYLEQVSSKLDGIELDERSKKLALIMLDSSYSPESTSYLLKSSLDDLGLLSDDKYSAIEMLAKNGFASSVMPQILETAISEQEQQINLDLCKNACDLKNKGFEDIEAFRFAKYLESGFQDVNAIKGHILRMSKSEISNDSIIEILNALRVYDYSTKSYVVDDSSVQSILKCKKSLNVTRQCERLESESPIRELGVQKYISGDSMMIVRDGKISYIQPEEGETAYSLQQKYNEFLSNEEDRVLCEFAKKYSDKNGIIDSKYPRVLALLRKYGVVASEILKLTDTCFSKDGSINSDRLLNIGMLKQSGALSENLIQLLDTCKNDDDVNNAMTLTKAIITADVVVELLPKLNCKSDVTEFLAEFSPLFQNKNHLLDIANLIGLDESDYDENAMDVLDKLADGYFNVVDSTLTEDDFIDFAKNFIDVSKNPNEKKVCDEAAGIISVMSKAGHSSDNVLHALELVRNNDGTYNEKLSDVVWTLAINDANIEQIEEIINVCKRRNTNGNYKVADDVLTMLSSSTSIPDIIEYFLG